MTIGFEIDRFCLIGIDWLFNGSVVTWTKSQPCSLNVLMVRLKAFLALEEHPSSLILIFCLKEVRLGLRYLLKS